MNGLNPDKIILTSWTRSRPFVSHIRVLSLQAADLEWCLSHASLSHLQRLLKSLPGKMPSSPFQDRPPAFPERRNGERACVGCRLRLAAGSFPSTDHCGVVETRRCPHLCHQQKE